MYCIAPGSVTALKVDPKRYYETAKYADRFDLVYWMSVFLQNVIETVFGLIVWPFGFVFWFVGCNMFLLDVRLGAWCQRQSDLYPNPKTASAKLKTLLAAAFLNIRFQCLVAVCCEKWETRIANSFKYYHEKLAEHSELASICVGAFVDVLYFRFSRFPVLVSRYLLLQWANVKVLFAAAKCAFERVLAVPLSSLEDGYLTTYMQLRRDISVLRTPPFFDSDVENDDDEETEEKDYEVPVETKDPEEKDDEETVGKDDPEKKNHEETVEKDVEVREGKKVPEEKNDEETEEKDVEVPEEKDDEETAGKDDPKEKNYEETGGKDDEEKREEPAGTDPVVCNGLLPKKNPELESECHDEVDILPNGSAPHQSEK